MPVENILHIIVNDEDTFWSNKVLTKSKSDSFYQRLVKEKYNFIQVKNYDEFCKLVQMIDTSDQISIWVHPNMYELEALKSKPQNSERISNSGIETAKLFEKLKINFHFASRKPTDKAVILNENFKNIPCIDILDLSVHDKMPKKYSIRELKRMTAIDITKSKIKVDYAVITALYDDEFTSLIRVFNLKKNNTRHLGDKELYSYTFPDGRELIAIFLNDEGTTSTSSITTQIILSYSPKYIFMTGVCGGSKKCNFGDVMVAKFVFNIEKGKLTDEDFLRQLDVVKINENVIKKITSNKDELIKKAKTALISDNYSNEKFEIFNFQQLKVHIDPMACTTKVIDKENYFEEVINSIDRKASAVEMESYGIARATELLEQENTIAVILKSVMDNTTGKTDHAKEYASYTSALFLKLLLEGNVL